MGTDFSRVRLDALLDYAGVELKQGAVLLDGDANEGMDILDRRLRALAGDMLGRVIVSETTPDAFEIKTAGASLKIGVGRLYVDGLLAECHGGDRTVPADQKFDSLLAEPTFANALPYEKQPYLHLLPPPPGPPPPILPTTGRHLVYLDVWNREVTHLEQPDLVEIAVGVEASSRIQTVWQVRVLEADAGSGTCSSPDAALPGWAALIAPSTGVLTTSTYKVDAPKDPCDLPPTGGYRGLENQLYRVEIHDPGMAGVATFKWSRDNACVGSRVASIVSSTASKTVLELETLGRDDVLSFKSGDWVEITDDVREFSPQPPPPPAGKFAPQPGEIRKITVDAARRRITFEPALPGSMLPPAATLPNSIFPKDRNLRVRRWDQSGIVNQTNLGGTPLQLLFQNLDAASSTGLIKVPPSGTVLILEHGVTVEFNPGANGFRSGDYWVFAARTADASVEELVAAPPRGVHHHYARLAIWDAGARTVSDCRPKRQAGCCTFVVQPGESIQAAIDALPPAGGCVCLKAGPHEIAAPIRIVRDNISLHGESLGAILANPRGSSLLEIEGAEHTRIQTIVFRQIEAAAAPAILAMGAEDLVIDDCRVESAERVESIGLRASRSADVVISGCVFLGPAIGVWFDNGCRAVTVSGSEFRLTRGVGKMATNVAILARTMRGPVTAEGNTIDGVGDGIVVDDTPNGRPFSRANGSRIWRNRIRLAGGGGTPTQRLYGIDVAARASSVGDNRIDHGGGLFTAIRLCGTGSSATGNWIGTSQAAANSAIAIEVGHFVSPTDLVPLERVVVADNIVQGTQNGISVVGAARSRVAGNLLGGSSIQGDFGIALFASPDSCVSENVVGRAKYALRCEAGARSAIRGNRVDHGSFGIDILNESAPTISGNRLTGLDQVGIRIIGSTERCHVIENRVLRCGAAAPIAAGVSATDIAGELHVESNEIMDTGLAPVADGGAKAPLAYGIVGENIWEARIENNLVTYSDGTSRSPLGEDRALRLRGFIDWEVNDNFTFGFAVQITNNKFIGPGASALVELWEWQITDNFALRFERVLFHGNYCWHFSQPRPTGSQSATAPPPLTALATVSLVGRHCSVTGNHVKAITAGFPSYHLHGMRGPFIGNVSHSGHSGRATQMPNPEAGFNTNP